MVRREKLSPLDLDMLREAKAEGLFTDMFKNKHISMTGTMSMDRADIAALIQIAGAIFDRVPKANTHLLIVGDTGIHGDTDKIKKARAMGITIIHEHEFAAALTVIDLT